MGNTLRIGITGNIEREGAREALQSLLGSLQLQASRIECYLTPDMAELAKDNPFCKHVNSPYELAKSSDVIIAMGGDGTMLGTARAIIRTNPSVKLVGVNLGKLGFLAENQPQSIPSLVKDLLENALIPEERLVLRGTVLSEKNEKEGARIKRHDLEPALEDKVYPSVEMFALNEIVIDNFGSTRMLTFEIFVDDILIGALRADGLIVATPTGSTGYAISAGGPIIEPSSTVLQITPIAPHSLNVRPIIIPENRTVKVKATSDETNYALIVADGQEEVVVENPALVTITAHSDRLTLLRRKEQSYFDLLRSKLLWSLDPRDTNFLRR